MNPACCELVFWQWHVVSVTCGIQEMDYEHELIQDLHSVLSFRLVWPYMSKYHAQHEEKINENYQNHTCQMTTYSRQRNCNQNKSSFYEYQVVENL
jgi:hypothetical protein